MGIDRLSNFIIKNINYNHGFIIDETIRKVLGNHILFDLNFIIYNQLFLLEDEVNKLIKIILSLPFSYINKYSEDKIQEIFDLPWWKKTCENIEFIFDDTDEDKIITNLINFINIKNENNISKIELMVIDKIINTIDKIIDDFHIMKNVNTLNFFIDGIPSFSKIVEQRKRRTKNYYESIYRKQNFSSYFENINNVYIKKNDIIFNYFKAINKKFTLDKSFSPISPLIKTLEEKILKYYKEKYPQLKIHISSGAENGESDIKIFQYIQKYKLSGDVVIHTTDSDLIHLMLVQQSYFNFNRHEIKLSLLKYNSKEENSVQYIDGNVMINSLLKIYSNIIGINTTDYRIIYDLCLILFFFGNDNLPSSFEIGPEIGLETIFSIYSKIPEPIINLNNDNIELNMNMFKKLLEEFQLKNLKYFTKILITRHFKLPPQITSFLIDDNKLNLNYYEILDLFKNILINDGLKYKDKLDSYDIRYKLIQNITDYNFDDYLLKFNENKNQILEYIEQILDYIDFLSEEDFGLILFVKPHIRTNDNYQDLYNILSENTITDVLNKNKLLYESSKNDYLELLNTEYDYENCNSYLRKIFHLTTSFFGNLTNFHTNNITTYSYNGMPKIEHLIKFLNENNNINEWKETIKKENLSENSYFNSVNHHIYITPYLLLNDIKNVNTIELHNLLNITDLWINNNDTFIHNKVSANDYLHKWNNKNTS
jgi:hypothetical protein